MRSDSLIDTNTVRLHIDGVELICLVNYSKIGYSYPRFFIELPNNHGYVNADPHTGMAISMSKEDWDSWEDTPVVEKTVHGTIEEYCVSVGLSLENLHQLAENLKEDFPEQESPTHNLKSDNSYRYA